MSNLKPCPFCGSEFQVEFRRWNEWSNRIECNSCCCRTGHFATKQEAVKAWNNRPIEDKLQAELETEKEHNALLRKSFEDARAEIERLKIENGNISRDFDDYKRSRERCLDYARGEIERLKDMLADYIEFNNCTTHKRKYTLEELEQAALQKGQDNE